MSIFKRLSATLVSRIDQVVGEIENHDAVIQATLNDMRRKIAEAKVRLNQVRREEQRLEHQIRENEANAERWRQRAVEVAAEDEPKALECVSRRRHCLSQLEKLQQARLHYQQSADKLARDICATEERLAEVKQKLTLMRARQSSNAAMQATSESNQNSSHMLEETFDRWEVNLSQMEITMESQLLMDPIEQEFVMREQEDELKHELAAILAKEE